MDDVYIDITMVARYLFEIWDLDNNPKPICERDELSKLPFQIIPFEKGEFYFRICNQETQIRFAQEKLENSYQVALRFLISENNKIIGGYLFSYFVDFYGNMNIDNVSCYRITDWSDLSNCKARGIREDEAAKFFKTTAFMRFCVHMAVCFMNSNVHTYIDDPNESIKQKKNRKKHKNNPRNIYKILVIEPLKEILNIRHKNTISEIIKRIHMVRGHFMTSTPAKPLFGNKKIVGIYWRQPHSRGSKSKGVVYKDYEVAKIET